MALKNFSSLSGSVIGSWWVAAFLICSYTLYHHAIQNKQRACMELQHKKQELQYQKEIALMEHEDLQLQINSQSDPAWIEMTLMKGLGMVPEGQRKVYFMPKQEE
jgi:hypothetical protein